MKRYLLFDIDGTLVKCMSAGKDSIKRAFEELFHIQDAKVDIDYAGGTDGSLCIELFALNKIEVNPHNLSLFKQGYEQHLEKELKQGRSRLLPGVSELLGRLSDDPRYELGILTGNIQGTALLKLKAHRIDPFFHFGGYGDHAKSRSDIARIAKLSAEKFAGGNLSSNQLIVLGDTPKDVKCSRAIGAFSVGVCTGFSSRQEIEKEKPHILLEDFRDTDLVLESLDGLYESSK